MLKKALVLFMTLILAAAFTGCTDDSSGSSSSSKPAQTSQTAVTSSSEEESSSEASSESSKETSSDAETSDEMFSDGDYRDVSSETPNAEIVLSGSSATISDSTRGSFSDGKLTITSKGIYRITGTSDGVTIVVEDDTESGNVYLVLDNVSMGNTEKPCIDVEKADKVIIQCVGENSLNYGNTDSSAKKDGAVYAKDDITVNGSGTLNIVSSLHGIVCKNDLKITGLKLAVQANSVGIKSADSLRIGGGTININCGHDGIKLENDDNTSFFYYEKAEMNIYSEYDGISVKAGDDKNEFKGYVKLNSGTINITTGGTGSESSKDSSTSQKGIKTDGDIYISEAVVNVSSPDDAVHGNADIVISSGKLNLSSSDDGITASGDLTISGGTVEVVKSYEGLEAENITISGGDIKVYSSDDGINCSGGSDTSSKDDTPWNSGNTNAKLTVSGGNVYVNSSGDGLDSNGSIYISGGTVIVEGPTDNGNGALDKGDGSGCTANITGGTVLAIGSSGMAVNFDSGTQCSALVSLSGSAGDTISIDDGSGFTFTATKSFTSVVYSSPNMTQGNTYTITAGSSTASADFTSGLYYSTVSGMGGRPGGPGGMG